MDIFEKVSRCKWELSKDVLFIVKMNMGSSLWDKVIEVRKGEDQEYYSRDGDTSYNKKRKNRRGYNAFVFKTKKEAELFLQGAQAFRDFSIKLLEGQDE